jgi:hypothetical protein
VPETSGAPIRNPNPSIDFELKDPRFNDWHRVYHTGFRVIVEG